MKTKLLLLFTLIFLFDKAGAQWTSRAPFPGISRAKAASFAIGDKVYLMGGVTNASVILKDFWVYDIPTNSWTQKPNFPGEERYGAASFVINGLGYISTGGNDNGYLYDIWTYNPASDSWVQRPSMPNGQPQHENQRTEAYSFVINNKAYIGGGEGWIFGANQTSNYAFSDLWEFDPATNGWSPKSGVPDVAGRTMGIGGAINGKGYVGLGSDINFSINRTTLWEYDPVADSWTSKASFPSSFTVDAGSFVLDSSLYIIGGVKWNPVAASGQVYSYSPSTDTWTSLPAFNGGAIVGPIAASNGTTAFVGTGYNSAIVTRSDFWQFGTATGITSALNDTEINIYPNPAHDVLNIQSSDSEFTIELCNISGQTVLTEHSQRQIDVSNVDNGFYILKITGKSGIYTEKIVVE